MGSRLERTLGLVFAVAMTAMTGYFTIVWPAQQAPIPADQAIVLAARTEPSHHVDAAPRVQTGGTAPDVSRGDAHQATPSGARADAVRN